MHGRGVGWGLSSGIGCGREGGQGSQSEALMHVLAHAGCVLLVVVSSAAAMYSGTLESAGKTCSDIYSPNLRPHKGRWG